MWLFWIHIGLLVTASSVLCLSEWCFSLAESADSYFMSLPPTPGFVSAVPICLSLNAITDFCCQLDWIKRNLEHQGGTVWLWRIFQGGMGTHPECMEPSYELWLQAGRAAKGERRSRELTFPVRSQRCKPVASHLTTRVTHCNFCHAMTCLQMTCHPELWHIVNPSENGFLSGIWSRQ